MTIIIMIISYALFAARDHPKIEMANADGTERQVSQKQILERHISGYDSFNKLGDAIAISKSETMNH